MRPLSERTLVARVSSARTVPSEQPLLRAEVLRTERLSPHWMRVTLRGAELSAFSPLGYDQWFRLFLPVHGPAGLARVPAKAHTLGGYLKFLRIPESARPVMRSYTVRAFRPDSLELDVDFVLHRDANGQAGPAAEWAETAKLASRCCCWMRESPSRRAAVPSTCC